jgi:CBS domain-containing protein
VDLETLFRFLISEYSYIGLFLVQVISSASILVPVPGYVAVFVAGAKLNPLGIALSSGLGSAVGELSGYILGSEGMKLIQKRSMRLQEYMDEFESLKSIMTRYGAGAILFFAAAPLPFDLAGILFGTFGYDLNIFFMLTFVGKTIKYLLVAFSGKGLFDLFQSSLEGRLDIYSLLLVVLIILLVVGPLIYLTRARISGIVLAKDIMSKPVETIDINASVIDAVLKMNKSKHGSIMVIEKEKLVGIITERDILERIVERFLDPREIQVNEIMSSPVVTIPPDTSIEEAAKMMTEKNIKKLPIMEDGKLVGIVTSMDLVKAGPKLLVMLEDLLRLGK